MFSFEFAVLLQYVGISVGISSFIFDLGGYMRSMTLPTTSKWQDFLSTQTEMSSLTQE